MILALTVGSVLFASAGPVVAQKGQSKSSKEKAAKKACSVGDYQKGVEILADIYVDTNDPAYVYNQGRCYQQNGQFKEAIQRFREYLRKAQGLPGSGSSDAEKNVAECEAALEREARLNPAPLPTTGPAAPTPPPATAPEPATPVVVVARPMDSPSDENQGRGLRIAGLVTAAVGVVAVGTGVGLALKTQSLSKGTVYSQSNEDQRASLEKWGWVSYGIGGAAVATGVFLYLVGRAAGTPDNRPANTVAILPMLAPMLTNDGASLTLQGSF